MTIISRWEMRPTFFPDFEPCILIHVILTQDGSYAVRWGCVDLWGFYFSYRWSYRAFQRRTRNCGLNWAATNNFRGRRPACTPTRRCECFLLLLFHSQVQKLHSPNLPKEKCIGEVMRIGSIIIFHLSKLWKAKFLILFDVIFLVRLQSKFDIDHSWEWKG